MANYERSKERQIKKLNNLKDKNEKQAKKGDAIVDIDLSGTQLKKWVVNNTERKLTEPQNSLLAKGLNFAVSVDRIPNEDFIVATEKASWKLTSGEAQNLRAEVAGVLKSVKIPKSNISKDERQALKQLKKDKSILIMGADKGRSTVVTATDEYEEKVNTLLSDKKTYEKLKGDPTGSYKRKLVGILQRLKKEEKIDDGQYKLLYPTAGNTPRIYCTTKIHKEGYPVRPIVDYMGSIAYQTSKALAEILSPMVGKTVHHVTNSRELAEELATVKIDDEDIFNSHDVVSLFTNTPINKTLEIVTEYLDSDTTLKQRTLLNTKDIIELLEFVLTTFMEWLEQRAIANAPVACQPKLWKRYVDDILEIIARGTTQELTEHLNSADPTNNIKFTYEEEAEGKLPFLDTLINRKEDGSVKLTVYRKKTHADQYLNFASQHPLHQKLGVVRTLLDRKDSIVTEEEDKQQEEARVKQALNRCGYPNWAIEKVKQQMTDKSKAKKKQKDKTAEKNNGMVVIPYVQGVSERLQRVFKKHNIQTAMKPHNTLKNNLVHPKDKTEDAKTFDCV
ncbi:uncharacterized protein [Amphiura filiformis]|uniref:uncharacterized protein n=1 Tax=Amphiura filiformis TaxID=82378 RepID=UPI003B2287AD